VPNAVHVVQGEGYRLSADALGLAVGVSTAKHGNDVIEPLVVEGRVLGGEPGLHRTTRPLNFDGRFAP
jgi:hypothetical protein